MGTERKAKIQELLQKKPFVSLREMEEMFPSVSSMTLRRDIEYFEKMGLALKVRGGMLSMWILTNSTDPSYGTRLHTASDKKAQIARAAVSQLAVGDSIFLDSGTTSLCFAMQIPDEHFTITTTGLPVAQEVCKKYIPVVNIVGGFILNSNNGIVADPTSDYLDNYEPDVAFIVPSGITMEGVISCGNYAEAQQRSKIIKNAKKVVALIDSTKFGRSFQNTICNLNDIDVIVTDSPLPSTLNKLAQNAEVKVVTP